MNNVAGSGERLAAIFTVSVILAIAAVLAPKDSYFVANFLFFILPSAFLLGIFLPYSPRPAAVAALAAVLALYLVGFHWWLFSDGNPESLAWLGYLASLPGIAIGAIASAFALKRKSAAGVFEVFAFTTFCALVGLLLNQALVCSTVMYCGS